MSLRENLKIFKLNRGNPPYFCRVCKKEFTPVGSKANLNGKCRSRCGSSNGVVSGRKTLNKFIKNDPNFYLTSEWRALRYEVLKKYDRKCLVCGIGSDKKVLHVDHIKPISKYPELKLEVTNLQILCEDCNLGKSNKDEIDWRDQAIIGEQKIAESLGRIKTILRKKS